MTPAALARDLAALERRIARLIETAEDEAQRVRTLKPGTVTHALAHAELRHALDALRDARAEVMALPTVGKVAKSNRENVTSASLQPETSSARQASNVGEPS